MDQQHQDELKAAMQAVPLERRHGLVLTRSGGALFPDGTGVKPVIWFFAKDANKQDEEEHFFVIDVRDAAILKRSIDKMVNAVNLGMMDAIKEATNAERN